MVVCYVTLQPSISQPPGKTVYALLLVDVLFLADMLLTFRLAYKEPYSNRLVIEPRRIARRYLTGPCLFDLLAIVPFWAVPGASPSVQLVKLLRLRNLDILGTMPITSKFYNLY